MNRRRFLKLLATPYFEECAALFDGFFAWRFHIVGRARCENGPVIYLVVQGKQFELTPRERAFLTAVADGLEKMEAPNLSCITIP